MKEDYNKGVPGSRIEGRSLYKKTETHRWVGQTRIPTAGFQSA
jgi:hypothetical protein